MSLANIKLNSQSERGFTIVELLIVVVVIAVLAAITIVSYNGITNNAKKSAAQAAATTFAKKAELYQSDVGHYPISTAALSGSSDSGKAWYLPSITGITYQFAAPSNPTEPGTISVTKCSATSIVQTSINATNITGLEVKWWDYISNSAQTMKIGNTAFCVS